MEKVKELDFYKTGYGDHERAELSILNNSIYMLFTVGSDNEGNIFVSTDGYRDTYLKSLEEAKELANKKCNEIIKQLYAEVNELFE